MDIARERKGLAHRSDGPRHERRSPTLPDGTPCARDPGKVEFPRDRFQPVVRQGNRLRVERVRLDQVGSGGQVLRVDFFDDFRTRNAQEIVGAF